MTTTATPTPIDHHTEDRTMTNALTITAAPGLPFIEGVREVDAPVALVWRAYTEADLFAQWIGPRRLEIEDVTLDVRPGGSWAFTHVDTDGTAYPFRGVVHGVVEHESITQTFEFLGAPGHVSLERAGFEDLGGGRTRIHITTVFQTVEARDAMVEHGMEGGMTESYERLAELLATLGS